MDTCDTLKHLMVQRTKVCDNQIEIQRQIYKASFEELKNQFFSVQTIKDANNKCISNQIVLPSIIQEIDDLNKNIDILEKDQIIVNKYFNNVLSRHNEKTQLSSQINKDVSPLETVDKECIIQNLITIVESVSVEEQKIESNQITTENQILQNEISAE
ncbi:hypothetical protein SS50377_28175 [Spironucleus salmonicida]|uniref:Uncharacterized protein n=1 Tax=Spironucleus salmonicida TaxID=348837 RepID=V6LRR1_9EUKA|nr:hypothetical protein SS50377_28175 [Spironucleus salmonicida]|eukprot:EST46381.1 Hypothetical protein SS50377_13624 [Spironucleus salmonicida]